MLSCFLNSRSLLRSDIGHRTGSRRTRDFVMRQPFLRCAYVERQNEIRVLSMQDHAVTTPLRQVEAASKRGEVKVPSEASPR